MKLGKFEIHIVSDGSFWLDGGAMFGIVPKVLWERLTPPDQQNRIQLGMNSLLVRTPDCCALVEAGFGRKIDAKKQDIYGLSESPDIVSSLAALGVDPSDVDLVILTHLHIDHAGWCTKRTGDGAVAPTFPRARYVVQAHELDHARQPSDHDAGSYEPSDFEPLAHTGQLTEVNGDAVIAPGIKVAATGGHTWGHQMVIIESEGERCVFAGDLIPTAWHLRPAYGMAYDDFPLVVAEKKMKLLAEAESEGWLVAFPHELHVPLAAIAKREKGRFVAVPPTP